MRFDNFRFETSFGTAGQLAESTLPEIAFSGRSNVGKSSLLNRIWNRRSLARVSSVPGKTVTVNFYTSDSVRFADLPGYGYAKVAFDEKRRWSALMETYFTSGRDIRLVVQLVDLRHPITEDDRDMLRFLVGYGFGFVVAATKADKLNKSERAARESALSRELEEFGCSAVCCSARTGEGIEELKRLISQKASINRE